MPRKFSLSRLDFPKTKGFKRLSSPSLSLAFGVIPGRADPGGAIVVSKKVAKVAAVRNRLKRVLRPVLMRFLRAKAPSVIVTVRKNIPSHDLRDELVGLLAKVPVSP